MIGCRYLILKLEFLFDGGGLLGYDDLLKMRREINRAGKGKQ